MSCTTASDGTGSSSRTELAGCAYNGDAKRRNTKPVRSSRVISRPTVSESFEEAVSIHSLWSCESERNRARCLVARLRQQAGRTDVSPDSDKYMSQQKPVALLQCIWEFAPPPGNAAQRWCGAAAGSQAVAGGRGPQVPDGGRRPDVGPFSGTRGASSRPRRTAKLHTVTSLTTPACGGVTLTIARSKAMALKVGINGFGRIGRLVLRCGDAGQGHRVCGD